MIWWLNDVKYRSTVQIYTFYRGPPRECVKIKGWAIECCVRMPGWDTAALNFHTGRQNTQIGMNQNTCQPVWFIGMPEIGMPTWIKSRSTFQGLSASIVVVWALVVWRWASPGPEMIIIFPMIWCPKGAGHLSDTPRRTLWFSSSALALVWSVVTLTRCARRLMPEFWFRSKESCGKGWTNGDFANCKNWKIDENWLNNLRISSNLGASYDCSDPAIHMNL